MLQCLVTKTILLQPPRILVVEDSILEQVALREILVSQGYRVGTASDGRQGYEIASVTHPDLILLDVLMHGMDGFAVCRLLQADESTADIPIIFLTGAHSEVDRIEGFSLGAVDYVGKPFCAAELLARITIHLRLARKQLCNPDRPATLANPNNYCRDEAIVAAAQRYIDNNLAAPLRLDELARRVGTYREKLSRSFLAQRGKTVFAYIRDERLANGAAMLRATDARIAEIARAVGFSNAGNFVTAFRTKMGVTPGCFRREIPEVHGGVAKPEGSKPSDSHLL